MEAPVSENTKIEWADASWSPWRGCTKVSAGCANCYAETLSKRNPAVLGQWGKGKPRVLAKNWNDPVKWNRIAGWGTCPCCKSTRDTSSTGNCKRCGENDRTFSRPRVFPSLCDWLDPEVPVEWLARFLKLIHDTPHLDWLLLTKRPENWYRRIYNTLLHVEGITDPNLTEDDPQTPVGSMLNDWLRMDDSNAPRNVWIGTSVEDQANTDRRIPAMLKTPARVRFLSVEPMLGPVDLPLKCSRDHNGDGDCYWHPNGCPLIDWVIVGGESGPGARPCNAEWIRELIRQCADAKVACFVKQVGSNPVRGGNDEPFERIVHRAKYDEDHHKAVPYHPKGGDPAEWPEDIRVRQMPEVNP